MAPVWQKQSREGAVIYSRYCLEMVSRNRIYWNACSIKLSGWFHLKKIHTKGNIYFKGEWRFKRFPHRVAMSVYVCVCVSVCMYVCLSACAIGCSFFRPLIGPEITWSVPGLSLVDPSAQKNISPHPPISSMLVYPCISVGFFFLQERIKEKKKNLLLNRKKMPKKIQIWKTLKMLK